MPEVKLTVKKTYTEELEEALRNLLAFCISGERYITRNPYAIPEVKAGMRLVGDPVLGQSARAYRDELDGYK